MKKSSKRTGGKNITRLEFHQFQAVTLSSGAGQINVHPPGLGNLSQLATSFELYKVTDLRFRLFPNTALTGNQSAAFIPDATVPTSGNYLLNSENLDCVILSRYQTVPTEWCRVPPTRLAGQLAWYKSNQDAAASELEIQGVINLSGTTTEVVSIEFRGVFLLKNPIDSSFALGHLRQRIRAEVLEEMRGRSIGVEVTESGPVKITRRELASPSPPPLYCKKLP